MTRDALRSYFEEQIEFRLGDGTPVDGGIYIGETEFLPVETLREDEAAYGSEFDRWVNETWVPEQADRRGTILRLRANFGRFTDLIAAVSRDQVVPLVGSGLCVASGLPTWSNLLRQIRTFTRVSPDDLERLLAESQYEEAASLLAEATNARLIDERIEQELRIEDAQQIVGAVRLLPAVFPQLAITTNLDQVLELQYEECGTPFQHVLAGSEISSYRHLKSPNDSFLLKLHGDSRRLASRVIFPSEYDTAYAPGGVVREELALLFRTQHILFLGGSLGPDRTVTLIAEVSIADSNTPRHFAFLRHPSTEQEWLDRELFLTERGIYPIWFDGPHDESIAALLAGLPGLTT